MTRYDEPYETTEQMAGRTDERTIDLTAAERAPDPEVEAGLEPPRDDQQVDGDVALLDESHRTSFEQRWSEAQGRFVDDPRGAVHDADQLVSEVVEVLSRGFTERKAALEQQWSSDGRPDTEQLRQALQRYRLFFSRLLAA
jgi:hypothetical protein